jgi:hypothetical protein
MHSTGTERHHQGRVGKEERCGGAQQAAAAGTEDGPGDCHLHRKDAGGRRHPDPERQEQRIRGESHRRSHQASLRRITHFRRGILG